MIKLLGVMALALAGVANAGDINFSAPTTCPNYCTGYTVDPATNTVGSINVALSSTYAGAPYTVTAVVNGKTYRGSTTRDNPTVGTLYNVPDVGQTGVGDGTYLTATINLLYGRKCAGKYNCRTVYYADSGTLTSP
jgi:hypothetical protein